MFNTGYSIPAKPFDHSLLIPIASTYNQLLTQVDQHIKDNLKQLDGQVTGLHQQVQGWISRQLDKPGDKLTKLHDKVDGHLMGQWENLAINATLVGIPPLDPDNTYHSPRETMLGEGDPPVMTNATEDLTNPQPLTNTVGDTVLVAFTQQGQGTFAINGLPQGVTYDASTGLITGTIAANADQQSPYQVLVQAVINGQPLNSTFQWIVNPVAVTTTPPVPTVTQPPAPTVTTITQPPTPPITGYVIPSSPNGGTYGLGQCVWNGTSWQWQNSFDTLPIQSCVGQYEVWKFPYSCPNVTMQSWSATGLPPGFSIDATSGQVFGTPGNVGSYQVHINGVHANGTIQAIIPWNVTNCQSTPTPTPTTEIPPASGSTGGTVTPPPPPPGGGNVVGQVCPPQLDNPIQLLDLTKVADLFKLVPPLVEQQAIPFDCQGWGQAQVGSEDWCRLLDQIIETFGKVGKQIANFILPFDIDQLCSQQLQPVPNHVFVDIMKNIPGIPQAIIDTFAMFDLSKVAINFQNALCGVYFSLVKCSTCQPHLVLGLSLFKTVLGFFKHLRGDVVAGFDFIAHGGVKLAFHLPFEIRPLEQVVDYLLNFACPKKIPSEATIVEMVMRNEITIEHARCLLKMHGFSPALIDQMVRSKRDKLHWKELIQYSLRTNEGPFPADERLKSAGWFDAQDRKVLQILFEELPTITEHLEWLRRNADVHTYVAEFGLWQGFAPRDFCIQVLEDFKKEPGITQDQIKDIDNAQAIILVQPINPALQHRNFYGTFSADLLAQGFSVRRMWYAYAAHWQATPPERAAVMYQRLRPGRVDPELVLTKDNLRSILIEQDIQPRQVDRQIAISYKVIMQRFLKSLYENSVIDKDEVINILQDQGYSETDAKRLADSSEIDKRRHRATQALGYTPAKVIEIYKAGLIEPDKVIEKYQHLGFTEQEALDAMALVADEETIESVKTWKADLKKCFLKGVLTELQVQIEWGKRGLPHDDYQKTINFWKVERTCDVKRENAHEIIDWLKRGILTVDQAVTRLLLLNYEQTYISPLLAAAAQEITKQQHKTIEAQEKQRELIAKQVEKQLETQHKKFLKGQKIKLDLDKAVAKANLKLLKLKNKVTSAAVRTSSKIQLQNTKDQAKDKKLTAKATAKETYKDTELALKKQQLIDLAEATDKLEKANIKGEVLQKLHEAKESLQKDIKDAEDTYNQSVIPAEQTRERGLTITEQSANITDERAAAKQEINFANREANIKEQEL